MKTLVLYDSAYGNTEKIASAISNAMIDDARTIHVRDFNPSELASTDFLFVGSPTQGGQPTSAMRELLNNLKGSDFQNTQIAAFDTRLSTKWVGILGYAVGKIGNSVKTKGTNSVVPSEGFFVNGKKGPLKDGELERAARWAKSVVKITKTVGE
jgi:flavodoxin